MRTTLPWLGLAVIAVIGAGIASWLLSGGVAWDVISAAGGLLLLFYLCFLFPRAQTLVRRRGEATWHNIGAPGPNRNQVIVAVALLASAAAWGGVGLLFPLQTVRIAPNEPDERLSRPARLRVSFASETLAELDWPRETTFSVHRRLNVDQLHIEAFVDGAWVKCNFFKKYDPKERPIELRLLSIPTGP